MNCYNTNFDVIQKLVVDISRLPEGHCRLTSADLVSPSIRGPVQGLSGHAVSWIWGRKLASRAQGHGPSVNFWVTECAACLSEC